MVRRLVFLVLPVFLAAASPAAAQEFSGWVPAGDVGIMRMHALADVLGDGRALLTGGQELPGDGPVPITTRTELYDPAANAWAPGPPMHDARLRHASVTLSDGRVLVAGGIQTMATRPVMTAEVFDPRTNTWTPTGRLNASHMGDGAVVLRDGRVLLVGGNADTRDGLPGLKPELTAEIYDPATNRWTLTGPMKTARGMPAVSLMRDGRVLAAGGFNEDELASAEIYDPAGDTWVEVAPMARTRNHAHAATLPDGRVLVAGGTDRRPAPSLYWDVLASAELFDPVTATWSAAADMSRQRGGDAAMTVLADGRPMLLGGVSYHRAPADPRGQVQKTTDVFEPTTATWSTTPEMAYWRDDFTAVTLHDGSVLVAGGTWKPTERLMPVPKPPAQPAPPAPTTPQPAAKPGRLTFTGVPKRLKPTRSGTVTVKLRCSGGACRDQLVIKRGRTTLTRRDVTAAAGRTVSVRMHLPVATRRTLRVRAVRVTFQLVQRGAKVAVTLKPKA